MCPFCAYSNSIAWLTVKFSRQKQSPQHSLWLVEEAVRCDYKTSKMNRRIIAKTRKKQTVWLNQEDEHQSPANPEGRPSSAIPVSKELRLHPFEYHPFFQGILIYLTIFFFSYGEDLHVCWTLIILFWFLLQTHLLIYRKWTFSFLH